eukprot:XP_017446045.1 PREDICTED: uncharacterized protein LOC108348722 [Rattus norvegicus]
MCVHVCVCVWGEGLRVCVTVEKNSACPRDSGGARHRVCVSGFLGVGRCACLQASCPRTAASLSDWLHPRQSEAPESCGPGFWQQSPYKADFRKDFPPWFQTRALSLGPGGGRAAPWLPEAPGLDELTASWLGFHQLPLPELPPRWSCAANPSCACCPLASKGGSAGFSDHAEEPEVLTATPGLRLGFVVLGLEPRATEMTLN